MNSSNTQPPQKRSSPAHDAASAFSADSAVSSTVAAAANSPPHDRDTRDDSLPWSVPAAFGRTVTNEGPPAASSQATFLYKLYDILSSSTAPLSSIAWLPHGHGFIIRDKSIFEKEILNKKLLVPSSESIGDDNNEGGISKGGGGIQHASFVRRLKRYKFVRITSGPEMGAYYHPYFHRDKPHLLPFIHTKDEVAMDSYAVNFNTTNKVVVNNIVDGCGGALKDDAAAAAADHTNHHLPAPALSHCPKSLAAPPTAAAVATFSPIIPDKDSLSLGTITPSMLSMMNAPSSSTKGIQKILMTTAADTSLFKDMPLPFKGDDDDKLEDNGVAAAADDDDVILVDCKDGGGDDDKKEMLVDGGGVNVAYSSASSSVKNADERKDVSKEMLKLLFPNEDIYAVQQQMLRQERMSEMERQTRLIKYQLQLEEQLLRQKQVLLQQQQQVTVMKPDPCTRTTCMSKLISGCRGSSNLNLPGTTDDNINIGSNEVLTGSSNHDMNKVGSDDNIVVAKEDMMSFPLMLREISKAKRIAQKELHHHQQQSPASSFSIVSNSNTTTINIWPTSPMGGGPNNINEQQQFQCHQMGSAPDSTQLRSLWGGGGEDMMSFPLMLREISKAKRIAQKELHHHQQQSPASSFSIVSNSNTTTINIWPTSPMGGGPNNINEQQQFQCHQMGSAPDSTQLRSLWGGGGEGLKSSTDDVAMNYGTPRGGMSNIMYYDQYHRAAEPFRRKITPDSRKSYTTDKKSKKYRYRRYNSCDYDRPSTFVPFDRQDQQFRNNHDADANHQRPQQQQPEEKAEEQPYFVNMGWNCQGGYQGQQQQQTPHDERLRRRHHHHSRKDGVDPYAELWRQAGHSRKDGGDPYAELWRQAGDAGGGFQYDPHLADVPDDGRLDLDSGLSDFYKPLQSSSPTYFLQTGDQQQQKQHHRSQLNQRFDDTHYEQIVKTLLMGEQGGGGHEQAELLPPSMVYNNRLQDHYGEYGAPRISEEHDDDFEPLPINAQFPSYKRRCTL